MAAAMTAAPGPSMTEPTSRSARLATLGWRAAVLLLLLWNLIETRAVREAAQGAQETAAAAVQAVGVLREDLDEALSGDAAGEDVDGPTPTAPGASLRSTESAVAAQAV
jgi:hypothetical protein